MLTRGKVARELLARGVEPEILGGSKSLSPKPGPLGQALGVIAHNSWTQMLEQHASTKQRVTR